MPSAYFLAIVHFRKDIIACIHLVEFIYISPIVEFNEGEFPYTKLFPTLQIAPAISIPQSTAIPDFILPSNTSLLGSAPHSFSSPVTATYSPLHSSDYTTNELNQSTSSSNSISRTIPHTHVPATNTHAMTMRAKSGIFKPRVFHTDNTLVGITEPESVTEALSIPG